MTPVACPKCQTIEHIIQEPSGPGYLTYCRNCYDGDCVGDPPTFVTSSLQGWGRGRESSFADWNREVEEYEPTEVRHG